MQIEETRQLFFDRLDSPKILYQKATFIFSNYLKEENNRGEGRIDHILIFPYQDDLSYLNIPAFTNPINGLLNIPTFTNPTDELFIMDEEVSKWKFLYLNRDLKFGILLIKYYCFNRFYNFFSSISDDRDARDKLIVKIITGQDRDNNNEVDKEVVNAFHRLRDLVYEINEFISNLITNEYVQKEYSYLVSRMAEPSKSVEGEISSFSRFKKRSRKRFDRTILIQFFLNRYIYENSIREIILKRIELPGINLYTDPNYFNSIKKNLTNTINVQFILNNMESRIRHRLKISDIYHKNYIERGILKENVEGTRVSLKVSDGTDIFNLLSLDDKLVFIRYNGKGKSYFKISSGLNLDHFSNDINLNNTLVKKKFRYGEKSNYKKSDSDHIIILRFSTSVIRMDTDSGTDSGTDSDSVLTEEIFVLIDLNNSSIYINYFNYSPNKSWILSFKQYIVQKFKSIDYSIQSTDSDIENSGGFNTILFESLNNSFNVNIFSESGLFQLNIEDFTKKILNKYPILETATDDIYEILKVHLAIRTEIKDDEMDDDDESIQQSQTDIASISSEIQSQKLFYLKSLPSEKISGTFTANEISCSIRLIQRKDSNLEIYFSSSGPFIPNTDPSNKILYQPLFLFFKLLQFYHELRMDELGSSTPVETIRPELRLEDKLPTNPRDLELRHCISHINPIPQDNIGKSDLLDRIFLPFGFYHRPYGDVCRKLIALKEYPSRLVQQKQQPILVLRPNVYERFRRAMGLSSINDEYEKQLLLLQEKGIIILEQTFIDLVQKLIPYPVKTYDEFYKYWMEKGLVAPFPYSSVLEDEGPIFFFVCEDWIKEIRGDTTRGKYMFPYIKAPGKVSLSEKIFFPSCFATRYNIYDKLKGGKKLGYFGEKGGWGNWSETPISGIAGTTVPEPIPTFLKQVPITTSSLIEIKHDTFGIFGTISNFSSPIVRAMLETIIPTSDGIPWIRFCVNDRPYSLLESILFCFGEIKSSLDSISLRFYKNIISAKLNEAKYPFIGFDLNNDDEIISIEKFLLALEFYTNMKIFVFANDLRLKKGKDAEVKLYLRDSSQMISSPGALCFDDKRFSYTNCILLYSYNVVDSENPQYDILFKGKTNQGPFIYDQNFAKKLEDLYFSPIFRSGSLGAERSVSILDIFLFSLAKIFQIQNISHQYLDLYRKCRAVRIDLGINSYFWLFSKYPMEIYSRIPIFSLEEMKRDIDSISDETKSKLISMDFCFFTLNGNRSKKKISLKFDRSQDELEIPFESNINSFLTIETDSIPISTRQNLNNLIKYKDIWLRSILWIFSMWIFEEYINIYNMIQIMATISRDETSLRDKLEKEYLSKYYLYKNTLENVNEEKLVEFFLEKYSKIEFMNITKINIKRKFPYDLSNIIYYLIQNNVFIYYYGNTEEEMTELTEKLRIFSLDLHPITDMCLDYMSQQIPNFFGYRFFKISSLDLRNKLKWNLLKELKILISNLDEIRKIINDPEDQSKYDQSKYINTHIPTNEYYRSKDDFYHKSGELLFLSSYEFLKYQITKREQYNQLIPYVERGDLLPLMISIKQKKKLRLGLKLNISQHVWTQPEIGLVDKYKVSSFVIYPSLYLQDIYDQETNFKYPYIIQMASNGKKKNATKIAFLWKNHKINCGLSPKNKFNIFYLKPNNLLENEPNTWIEYNSSLVAIYSLSIINAKELVLNRLERINGEIIETKNRPEKMPVTDFLSLIEYTNKDMIYQKIAEEEEENELIIDHVFYSALLPT